MKGKYETIVFSAVHSSSLLVIRLKGSTDKAFTPELEDFWFESKSAQIYPQSCNRSVIVQVSFYK